MEPDSETSVAVKTGSSDECPPGDLIAQAFKLQLLAHEAASRKFTAEQTDAIAALIDALRTLLDDEDELP